MNEHKHGDAYKAGMLRRMLAHETNACEEHYGAWLSHHDASIKHLTIDAGGIAALIRYYENHDTDLDGGVPEFELTEDELEAAYRKRVHQYRLADAEAQLSTFFGINTEKESSFDEEDSEENSHAFVMKYGYPFVELMDAESRNYALEALVAEYEDAMDCNVAKMTHGSLSSRNTLPAKGRWQNDLFLKVSRDKTPSSILPTPSARLPHGCSNRTKSCCELNSG